jgi:hypothetical protein
MFFRKRFPLLGSWESALRGVFPDGPGPFQLFLIYTFLGIIAFLKAAWYLVLFGLKVAWSPVVLMRHVIRRFRRRHEQ